MTTLLVGVYVVVAVVVVIWYIRDLAEGYGR
jgi:hypothetical protein